MYEQILVPTDGSEGTERAIEQAIGIAETYDATLHVLTVIGVDATYPVDFNMDRVIDAMQEQATTAIEDVRTRAEAAGVDVVTAVRRGTPHVVIGEYADEEGIDLIVMGTHGRTGVNRMLVGSVTERVVRRSDVPVLTVRMTE